MQMCSAPIETSISASAIYFLSCFTREMYTINIIGLRKGERDHKLGEVIACIIMIIILVVKFSREGYKKN